MIQFLHVTHTYEGTWKGIDDITFRIEPGEFVFLTGTSGAGKTTLLKHIYMEELPDTGKGGRVLIGLPGEEVFDSNRIRRSRIQRLRRDIGVVFQDFRLLTDRDVWDNVAFALRVRGHSGKLLKRRIEDVLERTRLTSRRHAHPHELSGGEQQRVSIARAIAGEPYIVLADEPTGNLDRENAEGVLDIFRQLHAAGTTIVMATHDLQLLERLPHRQLQLENGRLKTRWF
ncbi:MAG: ATP-binding cassette domain-containing protein [Fibrobacterota bacterium]|nr:ATP-binding cassette domain-containing protein [Fibrobacterota bacterium]QQS07685.1 MAG: ATP-binding cassette domain-containing protein [Fibrobacterota bacterium]